MIARRRFLALAACALAAPAAAAQPAHLWRGTALGADVTLRVEGGSTRAARAFFAEAARALRSVEARFSLFRGSDLMRLNAMGHLPHPSAEMLAVLDLAGQVHDATGGVFDPTVQPLWQARRRGEDEAAARALMGWADVRIARDGIRLLRPGMALTLNGIAQGHAADRLADIARAHDLGDVLIDAGETRALGPRGWHAAIDAPGGERLRELTLRNAALATSAPFGTRIGPDGDRPHILSPGGGPPRWSVVSVSAPQAALADALSTAFCVMDRAAIDGALSAFPHARVVCLNSL